MEMSQVGHHYLLAAGTSKYRNFEDIDLPSVPADVEIVVDVFLRLGFIRILEDESLNGTAQKFRSALNGWLHAPERTPKDRLVFYYSGHGEKTARHYLLFSDSKEKQFVETALAVESIMEMVFESPVQHAWMILDTCYSGAGIADAAALSIRVSVPQELAAVHGYYFMAAARAREYAYETTQFASVLARALRNEEGKLGGKSLPFLHPDAVLGFVSEVLTKAGSQQHVTGSSADTAGLPELIPNLRYTGAVPGLTIEEQNHAQSIARRNADHAGHWLPRALGSDTGLKASYFTGRQRLLSEIESWLKREKPDGKARVIVGGPGTGKSAILGKLVVALPGQPGVIDIALHARNKTLRDAILEFAGSVPVPEVQSLLGTAAAMSDIESAAAIWISNVEQRNCKTTIVVDALDESKEPDLIARHLLIPLSSLPSVWLLVGSRPDIPAGRPGPRLRILAGTSVELDLDLLEYLGPTDIADYVASLLLAEQEPDRATPYRGRTGVARTVASAVARRACGNFLVARILAKNLIDAQSIPDVTVPDWNASLPATIGAAFDEFLARFDDPKYRDLSRQSAIDLLLPLAYSEGEGFPWENLWASTASAISGSDYSDADVRRILTAAAAFIIESRSAAGSVYRLYHAALASHLRELVEPRFAQRRIVEALRASVPIAHDGTPHWARANVYIRSHMVAHAKVSGDLDGLVVDPAFLLASDPAALFQAARFVNTPEARSAIYMYSSVLHHLQSEEPETFSSYLEMVARQNGNASFAGCIRDRFPNRPWFVTMAAWRTLSVHSVLSAYPREHVIRDIASFGPPEEQRIATIGSDGWVWVTDPYRGTRLAGFRCVTESGAYSIIVAAFCRMGEKMVVIFCDTNGRLQVWDIDSAERLYDIAIDSPDPDARLKSVAATLVDGTPVVAVGSGYGEVAIYDLRDGSEIGKMSGYTISTNMIAFVQSTSPTIMVNANDDGVRAWNIGGHSPEKRYRQRVEINSACLLKLASRSLVVAGSGSGVVTLWDAESGEPAGQFDFWNGNPPSQFDERSQSSDFHDRYEAGMRDAIEVVACADSSGGGLTALYRHGGVIEVRDLAGRRQFAAVVTSNYFYSCKGVIASLNTRPTLITADQDAVVRMWDLQIGSAPPTSSDTSSIITAAVLVTGVNESLGILATDDRLIHFLSPTTGKPTRLPATGHTGKVYSFAVLQYPSGPLVLSASEDASVRFWDGRNGSAVGEPLTPLPQIRIMEIAACEVEKRKVFVCGFETGQISCFDADSHQLIWGPHVAHVGVVQRLSLFVLEGRPVAVVAGPDGKGHVYDLITGQKLKKWVATSSGDEYFAGAGYLDGAPVLFDTTAAGDLVIRDARTCRLIEIIHIIDTVQRHYRPHIATAPDVYALLLGYDDVLIAVTHADRYRIAVGAQISRLTWIEGSKFAVFTRLGFMVFEIRLP